MEVAKLKVEDNGIHSTILSMLLLLYLVLCWWCINEMNAKIREFKTSEKIKFRGWPKVHVFGN